MCNDLIHKRLGKVSDVKVEWSGEPLTTDINHKIFYSAAVVNEELICLGDHVFVRPDDPSIPMYIAQVRSMWQDSKSGEKLFHARFVEYIHLDNSGRGFKITNCFGNLLISNDCCAMFIS